MVNMMEGGRRMRRGAAEHSMSTFTTNALMQPPKMMRNAVALRLQSGFHD
jgi:hypothetical protein